VTAWLLAPLVYSTSIKVQICKLALNGEGDAIWQLPFPFPRVPVLP
jgi:hypothetical protein